MTADDMCMSKACITSGIDVLPCDDPNFKKKCGRNIHKPSIIPNYSFEGP